MYVSDTYGIDDTLNTDRAGLGSRMAAHPRRSRMTDDNTQSNTDGCAENSSEITLETVRSKTQVTIKEAVQSGKAVLVDAPPGAGKTTPIPQIANETGTSLTYLTQRTDLYDQMKKLCRQAGVSSAEIPSPHRYCPTFEGEHGKQWKDEMEELYDIGLSGRRIHEELEPPCHPDCPYLEAWDALDPERTDVLIGHCQHAYIQSIIEERVVVIDEFPGNAFINHFDNPGPIISAFLDEYNLGYSDFTDLLENGSGSDIAHAILSENLPRDRNPNLVLENLTGDLHALAGPLTFGLAGRIDLGNGFESTRQYVPNDSAQAYIPSPDDPWRDVLLNNQVVVHNRKNNQMWILSPPDLSPAAGIVGLDGTPTKMLWDLVCNQEFSHHRVLDADEVDRYLKEVQGYTIKQAGDGRKPYSSGNYVSLDHDGALILGVDVNHDQSPCLISSKKALEKYREAGLLRWVEDSMHYGTVKSSNRFAGKQVGIVSGSPHPGDQVLQRWGAFMGHSIPSPDQGEEKDYGQVGNHIYRHFVHNEVLQAILRFGRQGQSSTVYVNTQAIPDWLTIDSDLDVSLFAGEKTREIVDFLREHTGEDITKSRICQECSVSPETAHRVLEEMKGRYVKKHDNLGRNGAHLYEWSP